MATESDFPHKPQETAKAVALETHANQPPQVIAKGRGSVAEAILRIAFDHGIHVREDGDLVEVLEQLDINSLIPLDALPAVLEILHYLYLIQDKASPTSSQPTVGQP